MFQTGYLTIKKTGTIFNQVIHTLSYPNFEDTSRNTGSNHANSKNPLAQIKEKRYFEKYMGDGRNIFLIGIEFSKEKRDIVSFEWEQA